MILVTGGGGFIGKAIVRALVDRGESVRVFCRGDYPELRGWHVELCRGDLSDAEAVNAAVEGVEGVIHVASLFGLWGPYDDFFQTNVLGTRHVIEACRAHGVARLVYTSTPSVVHGGEAIEGANESAPYPERFEAFYPETKAIAEREVLAANGDLLATVAIRPHLVWGPGDTSALPLLVRRAKAGRLAIVGEPQQVDTTYIDNAVSAHLLAYDRLALGSPVSGRAYFVTQGDPVSCPKFIDDMLDAAGLEPIARRIPTRVALAAAICFEGVWKLLRLRSEPPVTRFMVSQLSTAHWYDISAARRDLGYEPAVTYAEGMHRLKSWVRQAAPKLESAR